MFTTAISEQTADLSLYTWYGSEQSYMYPILEGSVKKGANSVCSFLHHAIQEEFDTIHHKKIVLFLVHVMDEIRITQYLHIFLHFPRNWVLTSGIYFRFGVIRIVNATVILECIRRKRRS